MAPASWRKRRSQALVPVSWRWREKEEPVVVRMKEEEEPGVIPLVRDVLLQGDVLVGGVNLLR